MPHASSHCSAEWYIRNNKVHFDQLLPSFTAASVGVINPSPSSANNKRRESATSFVVVIFSFHVPFWGELWKGLSDFGPVSARGVAVAMMVVESTGTRWAWMDRPLPQSRPWLSWALGNPCTCSGNLHSTTRAWNPTYVQEISISYWQGAFGRCRAIQ